MFTAMFIGFLRLIASLLSLYQLIVLAAVLITWVQPDPYNQIVRFLHQITDPALKPFRKWFAPVTQRIGLDLSPIGLIFALTAIEQLVVSLIYNLGGGRSHMGF